MDAAWIWDYSGEHPRNYWACFRKTFTLARTPREATFSITADSRYIAYVNGARIGQGPVRGWPEEPFYDSYDVASLLSRGPNCIAVLVTHHGSSTFQYIEAEAGLTAELDVAGPDGGLRIITDGSWKTSRHASYLPSCRNYPQQAYDEIFDARRFSSDWVLPSFDDGAWEAAIPVRRSSEIWRRKPRPRDIPFLAEEPVYPERVHRRRVVRPTGTAISLDLQPALEPEATDMNRRNRLAFLATIAGAHRAADVELDLRWWWTGLQPGTVFVNGREYRPKEGAPRTVSIHLDQGDNVILMDFSGATHSHAAYFRLRTEERFSFRAPFQAGDRFAVIGPFESKEILQIGNHFDDSVDAKNTHYVGAAVIRKETDFGRFKEWLRPVPIAFDFATTAYDQSVYRDVVRELPPGPAEANLVAANDECAVIEPTKDGDVEYLVDFGRELSGYLELELEAPANATVDLYGFEYLGDDGTVQHTEGLYNTLRYFTREGWQRYRSPVRRGLRYLQVTFRGLSRPARLRRLLMHNATYAAEKTGRFDCSDRALVRIWEISRRSVLLCMEDTFVDCPCYEQTFWVGDARGEALIAHYAFGAYDFARRCWLLVAGSLARSPVTESQVPSGWQNVLTAWSLLWMFACREYHLHSGDEAFLAEIWPALLKNARGMLDRLDDRDLLAIEGWNMLDWAPMDTPDRGIVTHQNAELVKALRDAAWIGRRIGREHEARELEEAAGRILAAVNRYLWSEEKRAYRDCLREDGSPSPVFSIQTQVMAYLCGVAEGERARTIEDHLLEPPADFVRIGSPFVAFFYYEALARMRKVDRVLADIRKNYGMMLDAGATTCWETFPGWEKGKLTRSHCHGWSAAPGYFLGAYVLGVRPLEPGFAKVLVEPKLCDLSWASGSVPTPRGRIDIRCERSVGGAQVRLALPKGIEVELGAGVTIV